MKLNTELQKCSCDNFKESESFMSMKNIFQRRWSYIPDRKSGAGSGAVAQEPPTRYPILVWKGFANVYINQNNYAFRLKLKAKN